MVLTVAGVLLGGWTIARARRAWLLVTVRGYSMSPTLHDGARVLIRRRSGAWCHPGDVVVFSVAKVPSSVEHSREDPVLRIKRVAAVGGDRAPEWMLEGASGQTDKLVPAGCLAVVGDNARSQSSKELGYISQDAVVGLIAQRLRWGLVRS